jgi:hypothetical protein
MMLIIFNTLVACDSINVNSTNSNPINSPVNSSKSQAAQSFIKKEKPSQSKATEIPQFHSNERINKVIQAFNILSDIKIKKEDVSSDFDYQTFITLDGVWVRISYNRDMNTLFVDYSQEASSLNKIEKYCALFMKALDKQITDSLIKETFKEIETYKYQYYDSYKQGKFELTLSKDDLVGTANKRYTLKTAYHE